MGANASTYHNGDLSPSPKPFSRRDHGNGDKSKKEKYRSKNGKQIWWWELCSSVVEESTDRQHTRTAPASRQDADSNPRKSAGTEQRSADPTPVWPRCFCPHCPANPERKKKHTKKHIEVNSSFSLQGLIVHEIRPSRLLWPWHSGSSWVLCSSLGLVTFTQSRFTVLLRNQAQIRFRLHHQLCLVSVWFLKTLFSFVFSRKRLGNTYDFYALCNQWILYFVSRLSARNPYVLVCLSLGTEV